MGKPFTRELENINSTVEWANSLDTDDLEKELLEHSDTPAFIVGSGGSLSACYYIALLYQEKGVIAKAVTPLELFYSDKVLKKSQLIFISASGKNNDILFGFKNALQCEPKNIVSICMKEGSKLVELSKKYSISKAFEFNIPTGKDGFLATNSLVAYFIILHKAFGNRSEHYNPNVFDAELQKEIGQFVDGLSKDHSLTILYGGWGQPAAIDLESKCTEAALCNTLPSDFRNFGHGRHHWFAKKSKSAVVAFITPREEELATKTLNALPIGIPRLIIRSENDTAFASVDLLIKSFFLVDKLGQLQGIDPGRPGVPDFGSKLYNLRYASSFASKKTNKLSARASIAIKRKTRVSSIQELNGEDLGIWRKSYNSFVTKLSRARFGSLIFDYDGTLCSAHNRFGELSDGIALELRRILIAGFTVAVVTGRGKSVRVSLQNALPKELWGNVIVGYYNGADIATLSDNSTPNIKGKPDGALTRLGEILAPYLKRYKLDVTLRPKQLTVEVNDGADWKTAKDWLLQKIHECSIDGIRIVESNHSIDIIPITTSKLSIIQHCQNLANTNKIPQDCLCIGDKGQWPGNDFELLSTEYTLSVDEVSFSHDSCWHLTDIGVKNVQATLFYLGRTLTKKGFMQLNLTK